MNAAARREDRDRSGQIADFDDQMWPVTCAILVLAGFVVGIILANSDFNDGRLLYDGRTHLGIVAALVLLMLAGAYWLKGKIRRRLQFCVLLSLILHLSGTLLVYCHPVTLLIVADRGGGGRSVPPDEDLIAPDYHWEQAEEPDADQPFESPVRTVARDEAPPAATVEPPDPQRVAPVAEIPRAPRVGETPLGSAAPDSPVAMPSAPVVASRQVQPIASLAMNRQVARAVEMPNPEGEEPVVPAEASKRPPVEPQLASVDSRRAGAEVPQSAATAPPVAEPGRSLAVAQLAAEPGQAMPAQAPAPQLPSAAMVRADALPPGGGREGEFPGRPSTLVRAKIGGVGLPSSVLPNEGEPSLAPAAAGGSAGSRLEATSSVAVERAARFRAPAGPNIAAAGTQGFGIGSGLLAARSGIPGGAGTGRPTVAGWSGEEEGLLRAGAPGSFSDRGVPLPAAAARRARASQPGGGGTALSPGVAATLPKTQTPGGSDLPTAVLPSPGTSLAGAGGLSAVPGGGGSSLDAGEIASVRQAAASDAARARSAAAAGPLDFGDGSSTAAAAVGIVPSGGRGVASANAAIAGSLRRPDMNESNAGGGFARAAAGTPYLPGGAAEAALALPPVQPAGARAAVGPLEAGAGRSLVEVAMADTGLADIRAIGRRSRVSPTAGSEDPSAADQRGGPPSPQPVSAAPRGRSDVNPDDLAGGPGPVAVVRSGGPLVLEGTVKEPTDFYKRRGEIRHGLGYGDAEGAGFTEPAVEAGLRFFTSLQFPDGHWSLDRLPEGIHLDDAALGETQSDAAGTGLVLLAYLGAGYTHLDEKYRDVVRRGVESLVKHQKPDGDLFAGGSRFTHFYSHGIAAMALCEAYGMTQDPELREPARKAVEYIVKTQDPRRGGWRYEPGEESDTSVTGWQLMALKSAQMAGLDVPQETLDKIGRFLDKTEGPGKDGRYAYNPWSQDARGEREFGVPSPAMTAEAMLMRMYLGQRRDNAQLIRGAEYLAAHLPEVGSREQPTRNCYYWYYATQAMYQMQGPYWTAWHSRLSPLLKAGQVQDGPLAGSWHPLEPVRDYCGPSGGRLYVTAMHLLMLEVYYRHLPLFQELSK